MTVVLQLLHRRRWHLSNACIQKWEREQCTKDLGGTLRTVE